MEVVAKEGKKALNVTTMNTHSKRRKSKGKMGGRQQGSCG